MDNQRAAAARFFIHCVDRCATALPAALELSGSLSTVMLQCYTITDGGPGISKKFGQAAICICLRIMSSAAAFDSFTAVSLKPLLRYIASECVTVAWSS